MKKMAGAPKEDKGKAAEDCRTPRRFAMPTDVQHIFLSPEAPNGGWRKSAGFQGIGHCQGKRVNFCFPAGGRIIEIKF
jgi:hypothetical protein